MNKELKFVHHTNDWNWGRRVIIVTNDGCGLISVSFYDDEKDAAYIHGLSVVEAKRKQGYGDALVYEAELTAMLGKVDHIFIGSEKKWITKWYERLGYKYDHEKDGETILKKKLN